MKRLFLSIIIVLVSANMTAQESLSKIIKVTGEGTVKVVPDEANVTVRVENKGNNAKTVKLENDTAIANVLAYTKKAGIAAKDVQTEYVNLNKNYDYNKKSYNYTANQTISIKIRKLDDFDKVMSGLLDSGINRINSVNFSASNKIALESEARKKAVANAKAKAEEYAGVLGQKVGKAIQINEQESYLQPTPVMANKMRMSASMDMSEAAGPTIAPGELAIKCQIHITFALD